MNDINEKNKYDFQKLYLKSVVKVIYYNGSEARIFLKLFNIFKTITVVNIIKTSTFIKR